MSAVEVINTLLFYGTNVGSMLSLVRLIRPLRSVRLIRFIRGTTCEREFRKTILALATGVPTLCGSLLLLLFIVFSCGLLMMDISTNVRKQRSFSVDGSCDTGGKTDMLA